MNSADWSVVAVSDFDAIFAARGVKPLHGNKKRSPPPLIKLFDLVIIWLMHKYLFMHFWCYLCWFVRAELKFYLNWWHWREVSEISEKKSESCCSNNLCSFDRSFLDEPQQIEVWCPRSWILARMQGWIPSRLGVLDSLEGVQMVGKHANLHTKVFRHTTRLWRGHAVAYGNYLLSLIL